ncbi:MAG: NCS1 family nucleobase:cation symporter-1 [Planctomycetota bacterium]
MAELSNEDLKAVPASERSWTTWNYAALWIGMSICIPTYQLAAGYITNGMNWKQAIFTVLLGNLVVLVPMILNGHAGAKYGIPFPVFARASFGTTGANVPAILRAIVACGWFGIQTWIGGASLAVVVEKTFWPGIAETSFVDEVLGVAEKGPVHYKGKVDPKVVKHVVVNEQRVALSADGGFEATAVRDPKSHTILVGTVDHDGKIAKPDKVRVPAGALDVRLGDFICFMAFWLVNMVIVWAGIESIRKLLVIKSVFLPSATAALLFWAYSAAGGFGPMLTQGSRFANTSEFLDVFIPSVTGAVGFWATLSLNIPDFTRYAKGQKEQVLGQALGLPTSMTAVAFVGVAVTSATMVLPAFHGQAQWDPKEIVKTFESPILVGIAMFCVVLSTLATNIAANIVSPANDFSNLSPKKISFRTGGYITGLVGIFMFPWKLLEDPTGYIFTWLLGYSALLGPIGGILIADYFVIRRKALDVDDLYSPVGRYRYNGGWNPAALIALVVGILPNVPGFLMQIAPNLAKGLPAFFATVFGFAWFVGFGLSAVVYIVLMKMRGADAMRDGKAAI